MGQGCQRPRGIQLGGLGSTQQGRKGRGESGDVSGLSSALLAAVPTQTECLVHQLFRQEHGWVAKSGRDKR